MKKITGYLLLAFSIVIVGYGCGPLETVSGDRSITYEEDFNTMIETAEQAIRGSMLDIHFAQESDDGERYIIRFNAKVNIDSESIQKDQGELIIQRMSEKQTKVVINNPEYHFSVPDHQRKEYDRTLKNRIDSILGV